MTQLWEKYPVHKGNENIVNVVRYMVLSKDTKHEGTETPDIIIHAKI